MIGERKHGGLLSIDQSLLRELRVEQTGNVDFITRSLLWASANIVPKKVSQAPFSVNTLYVHNTMGLLQRHCVFDKDTPIFGTSKHEFIFVREV